MATNRSAADAMQRWFANAIGLRNQGPAFSSNSSGSHIEYIMKIGNFESHLRIWAELENGQAVLRGEVVDQGTYP